MVGVRHGDASEPGSISTSSAAIEQPQPGSRHLQADTGAAGGPGAAAATERSHGRPEGEREAEEQVSRRGEPSRGEAYKGEEEEEEKERVEG